MSSPLSVLVLGGTSWLGGAVARHAQEAGHVVTCLARGESGPRPDAVAWVQADRDDPDAAYDEVSGRDWDVVVDVARQPLHVRGALRALAEDAGHWLFVSTCSVYADDGTPGDDESAALLAPWVGDGLAPEEEYGAAKAACERAVLAARPDALVARSGLIVGAGDRSDRFGYWPGRLARARVGEQVLVPPRDHALQVIDVDDLAAWLVRCAVDHTGGDLQCDGRTDHPRCALRGVRRGSPGESRAGRGPGGLAPGQRGEPWMGPDSLPLWLPQPEYAGFMTRDHVPRRVRAAAPPSDRGGRVRTGVGARARARP